VSCVGTLYIFGGSCPLTEFCHVQNCLCFQVLGSPIVAILGLLHGTRAVGVSQTAAFSRERHLYSAGRPRPSRWALAHILVNMFFSIVDICLSCGRYSPTKLCDGTQMAIFWRFLRRTFSVSRAQPIFRPEARVYRQHCAQRKSAGI